jgi:hypothetical protein
MKKVLFFAALAMATVACTEQKANVEETTVDTTATEVVIPSEDEIPGPGHVEAEEGTMVEGPGSSAVEK